MKAFDNASGKWPMSVPEIAASLLVNLSAHLLKWQNPGEACGDLLQPIAVKWHESIRKILRLMHILRGHAASLF